MRKYCSEKAHSLLSKSIRLLNNNTQPPILINITLDYETWQPVKPGYVIDWEKDIFNPTRHWMSVAEKYNFSLTFFIEMCEFFWLQKHIPSVALQMELQIQDIVRRGHDVQLHLHPAWIPELGVKYENNKWHGLNKNHRLHDIPLDIEKIIIKAKNDLDIIAQKINPNFKVTCFRARKYQIQPSNQIIKILKKAGILADSSVWSGGYSKEHYYDFREAHHSHQPYFIKEHNVNKASIKKDFLEIPIFSENGYRWSLDNYNTTEMISPLLAKLNCYGYNVPVTIKDKLRKFKYLSTIQSIPSQNALIFTAIAHTKIYKSNKDLEDFFTQLSFLPHTFSSTLSNTVKIHFETDFYTSSDLNWKKKFKIYNTIPRDKYHFFHTTKNKPYWEYFIKTKIPHAQFNNSINKNIECVITNEKTSSTFNKKLSPKTLILNSNNKKSYFIYKQSKLSRVKDILNWIYATIKPSNTFHSNNPEAIIKQKKTLCAGYASLFVYFLKNENICQFKLWHIKTKNKHGKNTHELVEIYINKKWLLVDPTLNIIYHNHLVDLIKNPHLGNQVLFSITKDERWKEQQYERFTSQQFFKSIVGKKFRLDIHDSLN